MLAASEDAPQMLELLASGRPVAKCTRYAASLAIGLIFANVDASLTRASCTS